MTKVLFASIALLAISGCQGVAAYNGREFDDAPTITLKEYVDYLRDAAVKTPTPEERELFPNGVGLIASETSHCIKREFQVVYIDERYVSFRADMEDYHGGNGNHSSVFVGTIDRKTGRVLGVADFVPHSKWVKLKKELYAAADEELRRRQRDPAYHVPGWKLDESNDQIGNLIDGDVEVIENFYYAEDGLHFVYNPYEISCGWMGAVEVLIDPKSL